MQETQVWSLRHKDPLEKEMATHSSLLAWEIPWTRRALMGYSVCVMVQAWVGKEFPDLRQNEGK